MFYLKIRTRSSDSLLGESLNGDGLVRLSIQELVIHDLDRAVFRWQLGDLVSNRLRIGESGDVLSNTSKAHHQVLGVTPSELGLALLTQNNKVGVRVVGHEPAGCAGHTGVNTTAKTLVGRADDVECLLAIGLNTLCLGLLENLVGCFSVGAGAGHGLLRPGEFCGGDDLHGFGDLFDVADRLETAFDFT